MSFSVGASGTLAEAAPTLRSNFDTNYPTPAPGVAELFSVGEEAVQKASEAVDDDGTFSVTVSGHAHQEQEHDVRSWLTINIQPTT